ncbi:hypothetical protein VTL71DRAFT_2006 [Oculimacula yallundae]|uniref:Hard-surface induced protein 5 n=1 Tax=Oculimacula yallundae TaxID=86028 RepID=A0ABR4CDQ0_9HELO
MTGKLLNPISTCLTIGVLFLIVTIWNLRSHDGFYRSKGKVPTPDDLEVKATRIGVDTLNIDEARLSFLEIATKHGTDKVNPHHYNYMYEKHLNPLRDRPLKMLEIGLGCNMAYGPGKSYYTWLEFLPHVDMYYIEYDGACVEKWSKDMTNVKVFTGDQADTAFLDSFISASGGGFDIIIDDGGHFMNQQITSFNKLFPIVKPGGIYFVEDLATSYQERYGAINGAETMMGMAKDLLDDLNRNVGGPGLKDGNTVGREMRSIECDEEICAFFKKQMGNTEIRS